MVNYTVSQRAYLKIGFHAAKYPHRQVNGVLLGKESPESIEISDAIPLLHHWTSLSPSMEIGLDLASEQPNDTTLTPVGEKVAETIKKSFQQAIAFVVDGTKVAAGEPALIPYLPQGSSSPWRPAPHNGDIQSFSATSQFKLEPPSAAADILRLIRDSNLHLKLGDFDDHLEDVSIDWLRNKDCTIGA
ncbi:hypothetical protein EW145_g1652 [Phellinidium pouzarii]|uniref:Uncharacterized protein n=1 Tax=Phellinidium pouzarii TaxID=167371 RepID=A0A4S4LFJ5_9AGAM|nr:hypothetical protein EW145_g1652 [Phellinidium pouzarii]